MLPRISQRLTELLDLSPNQLEVESHGFLRNVEHDVVVQAGPYRFLLELKSSSELASIAGGIEHIQRLRGCGESGLIPLLGTVYMSESGRRLCLQSGVSWIDLAGNASIKAEGLRVYVEGRSNTFKPKGRPSSVFAPKSARLARWLLTHPDQAYTQRELSQATAMDEGFTSRIVSRLEELRLVKRDSDKRIGASDLNLLLDAWADEYEFSKHQIFQCHLAARSGQDLLQQVCSKLSSQSNQWAATGLAAAWLQDQFAGFRTATLYLSKVEDVEMLTKALHLRDDLPAPNLWLVIPNDPGVFQGATQVQGIECVHPVQTYLDLKSHPERSAEAAQQLRAGFGWIPHAR